MKTSRTLRLTLLFGLLVVLSVSCRDLTPSPSSPPIHHSADCRLVVHDVGQTEICGQPHRVAALSPYILDMMLALGIEPVGYSAADLKGDLLRQAKYEQPDQQIPYLGRYITTQPINLGDRHNPSLEALTRLKPDLILGEEWQSARSSYKLLSQIAPTVLVDDTKGGWQRSIEVVTKALNREARLQQVNNNYEAQILDARKELATVVRKYPRVLLVSSGSLKSEIYINYSNEFSRLLEALGFELVRPAKQNLNGYNPLSIEVLSQFNADIIMVIAWNDTNRGDPKAWEKMQREWQQIPVLKNMLASQAGRVYFFDARLSAIRGPLAGEEILEHYRNRLATLR